MTESDPIVDATPEQIRSRIAQHTLRMGSLWFPTPKELRLWRDGGPSLYWRPVRTDCVDVGPRLQSMWAAVFSPMVRVELVPDGARTRLRLTRQFLPITRVILAAWALLLTGWGVAMGVQLSQGTLNPSAPFWWSILTGGALVGAGLGHRLGGAHLDQELPGLLALLDDDAVDGEDWD